MISEKLKKGNLLIARSFVISLDYLIIYILGQYYYVEIIM